MKNELNVLGKLKVDLEEFRLNVGFNQKTTTVLSVELVSLIRANVKELEGQGLHTKKVKKEMVCSVMSVLDLKKRSAQNYIAVAKRLSEGVFIDLVARERMVSYSNAVALITVDSEYHVAVLDYAGGFKARKMKIFVDLVKECGVDEAKKKYFRNEVILKKYKRMINDMKYLLENISGIYSARYDFLEKEQAEELEVCVKELASYLVKNNYCFSAENLKKHLGVEEEKSVQ